MVRNIKSTRGHKRNNENSMGGEGISSAKSTWNKNLLVIPLRQGGKACESTHFLLYDYWTAELA